MRFASIEGVKRFMFLENKTFRNQVKEEALDRIRQEEFRSETIFRL